MRKGAIVVSILVFGSIFLVLTTVLVSVVTTQSRVVRHQESESQAFAIAEAGLNYYKWFLAHYPGEYTNGTGQPGPYTIPYNDPQGSQIGEFELTIDPNLQCNVPTSLDITSEGLSYSDNAHHTLVARYARPSIAEYAYILNSNVWAGEDREIRGLYHSNGGIRMDGTNDSMVTSAQDQWYCFGYPDCPFHNSVADGVYGDGPNNNFWRYPVVPVDFNAITIDLAQMKVVAQSQGRYFPRSKKNNNFNALGYHVIFKSNGTFDVYQVNNTGYHWATDINGDDYESYEQIRAAQFLGNYTIPASCSVIFFEDTVWVEGVIKGKVTIASANLTNQDFDPTIYLNGNITYTTTDGSDGLTAVAQNNIRIPLEVPDDMELHGIFIAQTGNYGRDHYRESAGGSWKKSHTVQPGYSEYVKRDTLTTVGTIVSNGRTGTKWMSGNTFASGFNQRYDYYDRRLSVDPPPLTPYTSEEYRFVDWRDEE